MKTWWRQTPTGQRLVLLGLTVVLYVLGMQTWVWSSLDQSIEGIKADIAGLTRSNQESIKKISSLNHVEEEVILLREKLAPHLQQLAVRVEPQAYRRDIVNIGKRTGVVVRLLKPKNSLMASEHSKTAPDIVVKVEGSFHRTVQFLDELLELSWIQTVNPLVLARKPEPNPSSTVTTDFTIHVLATRDIQQVKEALET
jgi:Tfp pilus assembly protein PilO